MITKGYVALAGVCDSAMRFWISIYLCLAVVGGWLDSPAQHATASTARAADTSVIANAAIETAATTASQATSQETPNPPAAGTAIPNDINNGVTISGPSQENRFVSVPRFFRRGDIPKFAQAVAEWNSAVDAMRYKESLA